MQIPATHVMHMGFDFDGTLIDHALNKQAAAAKCGIILSLPQTVSGVFQNYIPQNYKAEIEDVVYSDLEVGRRTTIMPGALQFLDVALRRNIFCTLISRRHDPAVAWKLLEYHGFSPKYFHTNNTFFVSDKPSKNIKAIEAGVTHYIDDEPDVLKHLTGVTHKFLFDPYDVWPDSSRYTRATSWEQLSGMILPI